MRVTKRGVQPSVQTILEQIRERAVFTERNLHGAQASGGSGSSPAAVTGGLPKPRNPQQAAKQVGAAVQGAIAANQKRQATVAGKPDPKTAARQPYAPRKSPQERQRDTAFKQDLADVLDKDKDGKLDPEELPQTDQQKFRQRQAKKKPPTAPGSVGEDILDSIFAEKPEKFVCVNEDYADDYGRSFTEEELQTCFKMKVPEYDIDFVDWKELHFTRIEEGQSPEDAIQLLTEAESIKQRKMREPEPWEDPTKKQLKKKKALISANPRGAGVISPSSGGGAAAGAGASEGVLSADQHDDMLNRIFG